MKNLPKPALIMLLMELNSNGELVDAAENIEAPTEQLNEEGQYLQKCLREAGYTTSEDIYKLETRILNLLKPNK